MEARWWWDSDWSGFRRGQAEVSLSWDDGSCRARIYDTGCPITADAFLSRLPLEMPFVHVAWSGEMLMGAEKLVLGVGEKENRTRLPRIGDIGFDPVYDELTLTYGTTECRLPSGENTICVFGAVESGFEAFADFARARRFEGVGTVRIDRS